VWHPVGHILTTGSNDHTVKFWSRNRTGDSMRDKYNLNTLPPGQAGLEKNPGILEKNSQVGLLGFFGFFGFFCFFFKYLPRRESF
jgi:hypothetical protein